MIPVDILNDLACRFLVNLPPSERTDLVRLCFQLEQAHWFYLDYYCGPERPDCDNIGFREFARQLFAHCPFLQEVKGQADEAVNRWRQYKSAVPTYGAVLIDVSLQEILLVQGFYARASWGFPKGKVNENERPDVCATREVLEETGFDITPLLQPQIYLECQVNESQTRLYLINGVPYDYPFQARTRNEIKRIKWFPLRDLPTHKDDKSKNPIGIYAHHFTTVVPFISGIQDWLDGCKVVGPGARTLRGVGQPPTTPNTQRLTPTEGKSGGRGGRRNKRESPRQKSAKEKQQKKQTAASGPLQLGVIESVPAWKHFRIDWSAILSDL